jgi:hypothetical protein
MTFEYVNETSQEAFLNKLNELEQTRKYTFIWETFRTTPFLTEEHGRLEYSVLVYRNNNVSLSQQQESADARHCGFRRAG